MSYKQGESGNRAGREKGKPNHLTAELRRFINPKDRIKRLKAIADGGELKCGACGGVLNNSGIGDYIRANQILLNKAMPELKAVELDIDVNPNITLVIEAPTADKPKNVTDIEGEPRLEGGTASPGGQSI